MCVDDLVSLQQSWIAQLTLQGLDVVDRLRVERGEYVYVVSCELEPDENMEIGNYCRGYITTVAMTRTPETVAQKIESAYIALRNQAAAVVVMRNLRWQMEPAVTDYFTVVCELELVWVSAS